MIIKRLFCLLLALLLLPSCSANQPEPMETVVAAAPRAVVSAEETEAFDPTEIPLESTPNSTCFVSIGYHYEHDILVVVFRDSGAAYAYREVPGSVWAGLRKASSMGGYYNSEIKGQYPSERLPNYP